MSAYEELNVEFDRLLTKASGGDNPGYGELMDLKDKADAAIDEARSEGWADGQFEAGGL